MRRLTVGCFVAAIASTFAVLPRDARACGDAVRREVDSRVVAIAMPLGLPSLSPEDVQLVESWVAQGRPR